MPVSDDLQDLGAGPQAELERRDTRERLLDAVRRLPAGQRDVVVLSLEGFSHGEIGDVLGLTANNVGVRLNRAKSRLKTMLEDARS